MEEEELHLHHFDFYRTSSAANAFCLPACLLPASRDLDARPQSLITDKNHTLARDVNRFRSSVDVKSSV